MKKISCFVLGLLLSFASTYAQEIKEASRIAIKVEMPQNIDLKTDASNILFNRLNQAVALNGLGASSGKFLLVPRVTLLSKDVTTTIPQQFVVEMEVFLFIVDVTQKTILQQESIVLKGIAENENKAVLRAISSLQARNPRLKNLIVRGKDKIVAYYSTECDILLKKAESLIARKMYYEAVVELESVPLLNNNVSCFEKSLKMLEEIDQSIRLEAKTKMEQSEHNLEWLAD
ncbi:MAG: hypothetical protein PHT87_02555 [Bacteroidales bacterium]|jgi:hypothetical protein|nr:hypothetical protein [Bacteroidales bacterium]MDD4640635.1 hypothetical protein [Bacteroidales bacterium]